MGKLGVQVICYSAGAALKILTVTVLSYFTDRWIIIIFINVFILTVFCIAQSLWLNRFFRKNIGEPLQT